MNKYLIMPENSRWMEVEAMTPGSAYSGVCFWFNKDRRIAIMDENTQKVVIYQNGFMELYDE